MRKLMLSAVLMMGMVVAAIGCGSDNKGEAKIPQQQIELPRDGPVPAGVGNRGTAGKKKTSNQPPEKAVGD